MDARAATPEVRSVWPWLRPTVVGCLTVVTGVFGYLYIPRQPSPDNFVQPHITVYADQPGIMSALSMSMVSGTDVPTRLEQVSVPPVVTSPSRATIPSPSSPSPPPFRPSPAPPMAFGYSIDFSLIISSPITRPVRFVILLQYFPPLTG